MEGSCSTVRCFGRVVVVMMGVIVLIAAVIPALAIERVSVASDGTQGTGNAYAPSLSQDGRLVAFISEAANLVAKDTNGVRDIFLRDRQAAKTTRESVAGSGIQAKAGSCCPDLGADGRYLAFPSTASNLVLGDTNGATDIFVRDRESGKIERVSVASDGAQANSPSFGPAISADGRYVAFFSRASNLVRGDTNGKVDVFVHDRQANKTMRVSVSTDGKQGNRESWGPAISADGRYVAFYSAASNLVPHDTNGADDVFVHDLQTGQTERVSMASDGTQGNGHSGKYGEIVALYGGISLSADGRYVAFISKASNLVAGDTNENWDVFFHDRQNGATTRVSVGSDGAQANGLSWSPSISADGRYVAFNSRASNLVAGDTNGKFDVFVHDRESKQTVRVSVSDDGAQANGDSGGVSLSADGQLVGFDSWASNLVPNDTNRKEDVFVTANPLAK